MSITLAAVLAIARNLEAYSEALRSELIRLKDEPDADVSKAENDIIIPFN